MSPPASRSPLRTPSTDPDPSTDPTDPDPTDPDPTAPNPTNPNPTTPPEPVKIVRYSFTFFQVSEKSGATTPTQPSGSSGGSSSGGSRVNMNSGYTSNEIAQMRSDKEAEIKQLEFDIKMAEAEYKIMKKEFDNGEVKSEIDGYVVSVLTPEEALANKEPVVKVSGGGGFFVQALVGSWTGMSWKVARQLQIVSWNTGVNCEGTISAIGDYPSTDSYYRGEGNPTVSLPGHHLRRRIRKSGGRFLCAGNLRFCRSRGQRLLSEFCFHPHRGGQELRLCPGGRWKAGEAGDYNRSHALGSDQDS